MSDIVKYIKKQLEHGTSREELISHLVDHGWSEEVVRDLTNDVIQTPSAAPLGKLVLPSLTLITLVVILGFMISNNNITGTTTFEASDVVCLYKHDNVEKIESCCEEAKSASNCQEEKSAFYINNDYTEFDYSCDYKEGTIVLNKAAVSTCGLTLT